MNSISDLTQRQALAGSVTLRFPSELRRSRTAYKHTSIPPYDTFLFHDLINTYVK